MCIKQIIVVTTILCICLLKQLTKEYPEILTPDNDLIIGITQEPSTREYYLLFYYEIRPILDRIIESCDLDYYSVTYLQYSDFYQLKEIGSGGYKTVYTAKYRKYSEVEDMEEIVALKRFKNFDQTLELFISEVSHNW